MTPRKKLPSTAEAVAFINACAGTELVRKYYRTDVRPASIDFTIPNKVIEQPMNFALQRFWRVLGEQTYLLRPRVGTTDCLAVYEWQFEHSRKLLLIHDNSGKTIVRLCDQESMLAYHAAIDAGKA